MLSAISGLKYEFSKGPSKLAIAVPCTLQLPTLSTSDAFGSEGIITISWGAPLYVGLGFHLPEDQYH